MTSDDFKTLWTREMRQLMASPFPAIMMGPNNPIPPLVVPAAPAEPAPEPESASIQVLRKLLDDRRGELERAEKSKALKLSEAEEAEMRAADLRRRTEEDDRRIAAAADAIKQIEGDIELLRNVLG